MSQKPMHACGHDQLCPSDAGRVVFLPGWGFDGRIISLLRPDFVCSALSEFASPERLFAFLKGRSRQPLTLVGWSLGAYLALRYAGMYPHLVGRLYLLSARNRWPEEEIEQIRMDLHADPEGFMRLFYRKCFLGSKAAYRRFAEKLEEEYLAALDLGVLDQGLDFLKGFQLETLPDRFELHLVQGERDIVAPADERMVIAGAREQVLEQAGHLPFLLPECDLPIVKSFYG